MSSEDLATAVLIGEEVNMTVIPATVVSPTKLGGPSRIDFSGVWPTLSSLGSH